MIPHQLVTKNPDWMISCYNLEHAKLKRIYLQIGPLFEIMTNVLRMPGVHNHRLLLDPISKLVSYALQNCTVSLQHLAAVCYMCNRAFTKERDKLVVTRTAIFEFTQALKFKVSIPDSNFLLLADLILRDSGGAVLEEMGASSWCGLSETRSSHCTSQFFSVSFFVKDHLFAWRANQ